MVLSCDVWVSVNQVRTRLPTKVSPGSDKRVWWRCLQGHEYENTISKRTIGGRGCVVGAGQTVLKGHNDLATLNLVLAADWHPNFNGELTAADVTAGTGRLIWWLGKCGHPYIATVDQRRRGSGCAVCAGHQVLPGVNDLATTHSAIAAEWSRTELGRVGAGHGVQPFVKAVS
ncbi:zinc-ribbon domain-containing protein [Nocardia sp. KC 131]|uniref:zinc-ribbon domain-containing protein n=1 Tax=Nocardia arseniciresistens TaxID=3392119 RepID=UPI00398F4911